MTGWLLLALGCYLLGVFVGSYIMGRQRGETVGGEGIVIGGETLTWTQFLAMRNVNTHRITFRYCTILETPSFIYNSADLHVFLQTLTWRARVLNLESNTFRKKNRS